MRFILNPMSERVYLINHEKNQGTSYKGGLLMPMVIMNNAASMMALKVLRQNQLQVKKSTGRISSGTRINGAEDDTSSYSISERMKVQLRGLYQDEMNVSTGASMLKVAAGGIENIVTELRTLKELAINAANDHNTDQDRATLQKTFDQRRANIDDIANTTNYNGKLLLDGTYQRPPEEISEEEVSEDELTMTEPEGTPIVISGTGAYNITNDGVYLISSGYSGNISIQNGASNVKLQQENPSTALSEVYINGPTSGNMNLWIEDLNITNTGNQSAICFGGTDNFLTIKGTNVLTSKASTKAVIDIGGGLTIEGSSTSVLNVTSKGSYGALIGTSGSVPDASIVINGGTYNLTSQHDSSGAGIGSGDGSTIGDITINKGELHVALNGNSSLAGAAIGSGVSGGVGNITIGQNVVIDVTVTSPIFGSAGIGSGYMGTAGDITIGAGAVVNATSTSSSGSYGNAGAGIGSGHNGTAGDVTIGAGAVVNAASSGHFSGAGIGCGAQSSTVGDITIGAGAVVNATSIGSGVYNSTVGDITISASASVTASSIQGSGTVSYVDDAESTDTQTPPSLGNPLVLHTGTKAGQALMCYIDDMHCKAMGIDNTSVNTRDKAVSAIDEIDSAIEYALDEATTMGSYISRLEYTKENIVTAAENTQASESTIRDADMAKEMVSYTKNKVLAQAAQSMLAQSNQNVSNVLSLLSG